MKSPKQSCRESISNPAQHARQLSGIDILSRLEDGFSYGSLAYQQSVFDGIPVRVATPRMLYRMKKNTVRWKDRIDAQKIKEKFGLED